MQLRGHGAVVEIVGPCEGVGPRLPPCVTLAASGATAESGAADAPVHATVTVDVESSTVTSPSLGVTHAEGPEELVRVTASVAQLELAANATDAVFVHAGVVAHQGAAIVVPGRSMAGKTTLVRALLDAGATYYSDEYAVLDDAGNVAPYAKPLSVRVDGRATQVVPLAALGEIGTDPVPVLVVAALRYESGGTEGTRDTTTLRWPPALERGAAVALPLVDNAVPAQLRPVDTLDAVAAVARQAVLVRGTRPDAAATARWLIDLVDESLDGPTGPTS